MGEHVYVNCHPLEFKLHSHVNKVADADDDEEEISHRFINKIYTSSAQPQSSISSTSTEN